MNNSARSLPVPVQIPEDLYQDIRSFIAVLLMTDQDKMPISEDDAAYTMAAWDEEEIEYPAGMTPAMFSAAWNDMCMEDDNNDNH